MTIASKLLAIAQNEQEVATQKEAIRQAIIAKDVAVPVETPLSQYPAKIAAISGGGVCGTIPVHFFDTATGEVMTTMLAESGGNVTPPAVPTHEHLTFKYWKGDYQNVTKESWVGTIYETDEDATFLFITINKVSMLTQTLKVWKSAYSNPITIDWGDGTSDTTSNFGNLAFTHSWPTVGSYKIKITSDVEYKLGNTGNISVFQTASGYTPDPVLVKAYFPPSAKFNLYSVSNNKALKCIVLSYGITAIAEGCFSYCYRLAMLALPDTVEAMGGICFSDCDGLKVALMSNALTTTSSYFDGVESLSYVKLPNSLQTMRYLFSGNTAIEEVDLPSTLTALLSSAFSGARSLRNIDVPVGVASLSSSVFSNCYGLDYIVFRRTAPPTLNSSTFAGLSQTVIIYVPDESVEAYKAATNWSVYAEQIHPLSEFVVE